MTLVNVIYFTVFFSHWDTQLYWLNYQLSDSSHSSLELLGCYLTTYIATSVKLTTIALKVQKWASSQMELCFFLNILGQCLHQTLISFSFNHMMVSITCPSGRTVSNVLSISVQKHLFVYFVCCRACAYTLTPMSISVPCLLWLFSLITFLQGVISLGSLKP